jgi:hypothetical protein
MSDQDNHGSGTESYCGSCCFSNPVFINGVFYKITDSENKGENTNNGKCILLQKIKYRSKPVLFYRWKFPCVVVRLYLGCQFHEAGPVAELYFLLVNFSPNVSVRDGVLLILHEGQILLSQVSLFCYSGC